MNNYMVNNFKEDVCEDYKILKQYYIYNVFIYGLKNKVYFFF